MSDQVEQPTHEAAKKYNEKYVPSVTEGYFPGEVLREFPDLLKDYGSIEFALATEAAQKALGIHSDGCFGPQTYRYILKRWEPVPTTDDYVVWGTRRIPLVNTSGHYKTINYDQDDLAILDLHPIGHFSTRERPIRSLVLHWGGLNPDHLYNVMSNPDRAVSTHFGIGLSEDTGEPVVYQYMNLAHKAWHAGWANEGSIGIDICQQPSYKWGQYYLDRNYGIERCHNTTSRGNRNILSLDNKISLATRAFVLDMCESLGLPLKAPADHDVQCRGDIERELTVVGHHHISARKWDIACWWSSIFEGTNLDIN